MLSNTYQHEEQHFHEELHFSLFLSLSKYTIQANFNYFLAKDLPFKYITSQSNSEFQSTTTRWSWFKSQSYKAKTWHIWIKPHQIMPSKSLEQKSPLEDPVNTTKSSASEQRPVALHKPTLGINRRIKSSGWPMPLIPPYNWTHSCIYAQTREITNWTRSWPYDTPKGYQLSCHREIQLPLPIKYFVWTTHGCRGTHTEPTCSSAIGHPIGSSWPLRILDLPPKDLLPTSSA